MRNDFQRTLEKSMGNPEFRKLWEEDEFAYRIISEIIRLRAECGLTQQQLSEIAGIRQSNLSRIECGKCLPSLETLLRLAEATGKTLSVEFR